MENKVLGNRYELIEKIGGGGMAVVYKARCRLLNRYVAVKILRDDEGMNQDFVNRFKIEAQSAGSLSHPNVVSIYDVGSDEGVNYIVMELVEGYTLKEIIDENRFLDWKDATKVASQICSALEHAHRNKIIHRDIKSQNILVNAEGIAKVTDFGIAKAVSASTITMAGNTIGSVHYFSPEQAKGMNTDEKSDIYSLGIVLYEMVTGKVPFDADTPVSVALKQIQEEPKPPIEIVPDIPEGLNNIILKALQKDPKLRYRNATEMLTALESILSDPSRTFTTIESEIEEKPDMGATTVVPLVSENMINKRVINTHDSEEEEVEERKTSKGNSNAKTIGALAMAFLIVGVLSFVIFRLVLGSILGPNNAEVEMPSLVGMTEEEAKELLESKNIKIKDTRYSADENVDDGVVISQIPESGIKIKENTDIVELVISKNERGKTFIVANYVGKDIKEVENELNNGNFRFSILQETSDTVPEGIVISQSPYSNLEVEEGTLIEVRVSLGPEVGEVSMPNLVGKTFLEAKKILADNNLALGEEKYSQDSKKGDGIVLKQSISKGTMVKEGKKIDLTINVNKLPTQTVYINVANKAPNKDSFVVRVKLGTDIVYEKRHTRADEEIGIPVSGSGNQLLQVYIDGKLDSEQIMNFN